MNLAARLIINFLVTGILVSVPFYILYKWKREQFSSRKIQQKLPEAKQVKREIWFGISTMFIFSLAGSLVFFMFQNKWVTLNYEWSLFILPQAFLLLVLHDLYFYIIHRLMHTDLLFRKVHYVHHLSVMPTPFTSFSFHPYEAVLEIAIFPLLLLVNDWNLFSFLIFAIFSRGLNIIGHLGFDFFPANQTNNNIIKYLNTTIYHDLHHQKYRVNYGLYFNWWDRIFKTKDAGYEEYYAERKVKMKSLN